jgi:hypothetical protein
MLQNLIPLALIQRLLCKRSQQVGIRMDPGPGSCLQSLLRNLGKMFHLLLALVSP